MRRKTKRWCYQEPLFDEMKRETCFVCSERIKKGEGIYIGKNLWRHKKCKPGGRSWAKSGIGRSQKPDNLPGSDNS